MNFIGKTFASRIADGLLAMDVEKDLLNFVGQLETPPSKVSHQVFMQHACSQSDLGDTKFVIQFRSKTAELLYFNKLDKAEWSSLKEIVKITTKHSASVVFGGNVFEAIAHRVIPTRSIHQLYRMAKVLKKQPKQQREEEESRTNHFDSYITVEESPETIEVDFLRSESVLFTMSAPPIIELSKYYQGCKSTPLIDGFLLHQTNTGITVYLIQISTSQKKESHSLVKGPLLVTGIVNRVKSCLKHPVTIRFVLVGPASDVLGLEPKPTWHLPDFKTLGNPYEVYRCDIPIPEQTPLRSVFFPLSGSNLS